MALLLLALGWDLAAAHLDDSVYLLLVVALLCVDPVAVLGNAVFLRLRVALPLQAIR